MKKIEAKEGFPITATREINILLTLRHPNIIRVREMVVGGPKRNRIFMVMDYMEHDLQTLMSKMKRNFTQSEVKCMLRQLLDAVSYMHRHWIFHRDLKTSNLLYVCSNRSSANVFEREAREHQLSIEAREHQSHHKCSITSQILNHITNTQSQKKTGTEMMECFALLILDWLGNILLLLEYTHSPS